MTNPQRYAIRGGVEGRERLRVLSRVMRETSCSLLDRLELRNGMLCLDAGCGGGDMTTELARRVAPDLEEGLADEQEINQLLRELYDFAADESTLAGVPRIFQIWAKRPAAINIA